MNEKNHFDLHNCELCEIIDLLARSILIMVCEMNGVVHRRGAVLCQKCVLMIKQQLGNKCQKPILTRMK